MTVQPDRTTEFLPGYRLLDRLGSGGFGEVWRCEAPGGIFKAVKIIHGDLRNRETDAYRFAEQELKSLKRVKQVRHPYLLTLDRFDIVEGRLMIVMEMADCNLWDRFRECRKAGLPGIPREELLGYMSETAEVLDLMNDRFQLQHLDIKPQNLFLLYGHVKVADFGQVKDLEGMVASVTGGITPVYAAPETFDGFVSRYCDQYSLACVYQELLTGDRPFDGTSMQHLLVQHLQHPPNLAPSPPCDRPALLKALAKKPEDRFPNVTAMVNAIRYGMSDTGTFAAQTTTVPIVSSTPEQAAASYAVSALTGMSEGDSDLARSDRLVRPSDPVPAPVARPKKPTDSDALDTPTPAMIDLDLKPTQTAPPEQTGAGPIRPALIIGLGYTGTRVLQQFLKGIRDKFGHEERLPAVRMLAIDTDEQAILAAQTDYAPQGIVGLPPEAVLSTRLHRAGHYLDPRQSSRGLLEGWFDSQLLYKLPRHPITMGQRVFGRLAFCDHFRTIQQRIHSELDAITEPSALRATVDTTGMAVYSNWPRVYVVAGLAGGTGSGMFLDMAYCLRTWLRLRGYTHPDIIGLLHLPPDGPPANQPDTQAQANTYASLTELNHYSRSETTFVANLDERTGVIRDSAAPFSQVYMLPGFANTHRTSGSSAGIQVAATMRSNSGVVRVAPNRSSTTNMYAGRATPTPQRITHPRSVARGSQAEINLSGNDPTTLTAELIRLDLFSMVGRSVETVRSEMNIAPNGLHIRTAGLIRYGWPRAKIVARARNILVPILFAHWVSPDPTRIRDLVPRWAAERWHHWNLDVNLLPALIRETSDTILDQNVFGTIDRLTQPLAPKGWLGRIPDGSRVSAVLQELHALFGAFQVPTKSISPLATALTQTVNGIVHQAGEDLDSVFPGLLEHADYRMAGAEEAIRQLLVLLDRAHAGLEQRISELIASAGTAYELLMSVVNGQKGVRKPTTAEFASALREYPHSRYQLHILRSAQSIYTQLREMLMVKLAEAMGCRQTMEQHIPFLQSEAEALAAAAELHDLLPPNCASTEDAAQLFLKSLTDDDLAELDARVHHRLEQLFGNLHEACLSTSDGRDGIAETLREITRDYLDERLGEVDFAGMFREKFGTGARAEHAIVESFEVAAPKLVGKGPWSGQEINTYAGPTGEGGDPIRDQASVLLPEGVIDVESWDEVVFYREYPDVPIVALPQLGPAWSVAYHAAPDQSQITPHARMDVTQWVDVDRD